MVYISQQRRYSLPYTSFLEKEEEKKNKKTRKCGAGGRRRADLFSSAGIYCKEVFSYSTISVYFFFLFLWNLHTHTLHPLGATLPLTLAVRPAPPRPGSDFMGEGGAPVWGLPHL